MHVYDEAKRQVSVVYEKKKSWIMRSHQNVNGNMSPWQTFSPLFPVEHFNVAIITTCRKADSCYQLLTETVASQLFCSLSGLQRCSFCIIFMDPGPDCTGELVPNGLRLIRNNKTKVCNGSLGQQMVIGYRWRCNDGDVWRWFTVAL